MNETLPDTLSFAFGDKVWWTCDEDDSFGCGIVIGFLFKPGNVLVEVRWRPGPGGIDFMQQYELTKEKPDNFQST